MSCRQLLAVLRIERKMPQFNSDIDLSGVLAGCRKMIAPKSRVQGGNSDDRTVAGVSDHSSVEAEQLSQAVGFVAERP
jgi:hypothetical protein